MFAEKMIIIQGLTQTLTVYVLTNSTPKYSLPKLCNLIVKENPVRSGGGPKSEMVQL